jgi:hypothetical protein
MTIRNVRNAVLVLFAALALCVSGVTLAASPQSIVDVKVEVAVDVAVVTNVIDDSECAASEELNYTPAVALDASSTDDSVAVAAAGCKKCSRDRQWCSCTYNGLPRVSCDPCCYGHLGIPQVCLD